MTFEEFDKEHTPLKVACDPCVTSQKVEDLPPRCFIMTDEHGLAYYAMQTDDGRIVPVEDYLAWD